MRYAVWNNKGGVGKSFLTFVLGTEIAHRNPDEAVILVDMCPQANLSEIVLGGNGQGSASLDQMLKSSSRLTIGGYFDARIASPHKATGTESSYLVQGVSHNHRLPKNLFLIVGDPSLELQAQVISQIGGQTLPQDAWRNVHLWLRDLIEGCVNKLGDASRVWVFIDCNPSFAAYTELAMAAAERLIIPCSSDGSSARAIDNIGSLLYGVGGQYGAVSYNARAKGFGLALPLIHSVLLNRSTLYSDTASKAFRAMFEEIQRRADNLKVADPSAFIAGQTNFRLIPDAHSVAIVCSHLGMPLYQVCAGQYPVHDVHPQVNAGPLDRYKTAVDELVNSL